MRSDVGFRQLELHVYFRRLATLVEHPREVSLQMVLDTTAEVTRYAQLADLTVAVLPTHAAPLRRSGTRQQQW
jgi:hypothetical protein